MSCRKDGSLVFNIALHVGDKLRMAYGDPNEIINGSRRVLGRIRDFGPQGMLLFSCVVRRYYLKDDVNQILSAYERITLLPVVTPEVKSTASKATFTQ